MTIRTMLLAAVTTTAAAGSAALWYATPPQGAAPRGAPASQPAAAASPPRAPAPSPAGRDVVVVCIGADDILHAPTPDGGCAAGQKVELAPEKDECPLCPPFEEPQPEDTTDNEALNDLERRIRALENAPYFEVVNDNEQPVFRVAPDGVSVFNKSAVVMAMFGVSQSGGYFTAQSGTSLLEAAIAARDATSGFQIREDGLVRMTLSSKDGGGSSLRVSSAKGVIAGMGESANRPGTLLLGSLDGVVKATISVPDGRGMFHVDKDAQTGGLSMMEQASGGGMFQLDAAKGAAVKMGNVGNRYGIVMTGPTLGLALVPKSAMPGSFFLGCGSQAPPACVPAVP